MLDARRRMCCDRAAGTATGISAARRRLLRGAVFPAQDQPGAVDPATVPFPAPARAPRAVFGTIRDVSPHLLVLGDEDGERRIMLSPDAAAWRGGPLEPAAVQPGDHAVVRLRPAQREVADRIWANIGRVTGTIVDRDADSLVVDEGTTKPRQVVTIPASVASQIQVRFPSLEPGYLIDVIGLRGRGGVEARIPATSQPAYAVGRLPSPSMATRRPPSTFSGSATWHEPADEPEGLFGVAYPALDPDAGCREDPVGRDAPRFVRLPYLAIGSQLQVRNDCTGASHVLPVIGCGAIARLFSDRCVTCGTSPRGRVADLTVASFVALGGELDRGCFNTTITIGL
jgi:hypothetical protein